MGRQQGARAQMALAFETVYGTPPASGFVQMPFASTTLGSDQPLLGSELLGYGRDPLPPILDAITADGDVVIPIDAEAFGYWLKGCFGDPITTGTGPYDHEFRSGGWALPSMSIETQMPQIPRFAMYPGCMVDKLEWTMAKSGLLTAKVGLIAQGEDVAGATAAGALSQVSIARFGHFNGDVKRNGTSLGNLTGASISYMNNLDKIDTIRSDGKIDGADPSIAACNGKIDVRFSDLTLYTQALNGQSCDLEFGYVLPGGESLTFTVHGVYLPRPRAEISGPGGIQCSFDWQGATDSVAGRMVTVNLSNDVAAY